MTGRTVVLLLALVGTGAAQVERGMSDMVRRVRVRVSFANNSPCDSSTRISLAGDAGFAVAEGSVNGECVAEFFDVPAGNYRVTLSGPNVANADEGAVEINPVIVQELQVRARHTGESDPMHGAAAGAFVSAVELGTPSNAVKEFEKASHLIAKQDWPKAVERLRKAIADYPSYAAAYNNLGIVYLRMGKSSQAREALQKAISLNDHLAPAYVNLSRVNISANDFQDAESLLSKATSLAPPDAATLSLLAFAQLSDQHLDQAIETSHQGHATRVSQHGFLHLVAARAYEQKHRIPDSIAELQLYLSEEPGGPRAEEVRKALATLQTQARVQ